MIESHTYTPLCVGNQNDLLSEGDYKKADLHLHTQWSDGSISSERLVEIAILSGLDAIAITDHDNTHPSDMAINYVARNNLPLEVVRGCEVSSKDGHVLALGAQDDIPSGMILEDTLKEIHRQKGLAIVVHPDQRWASSVSLKRVSEIIDSDDQDLYFDGIEIFNAFGERLHRLDRSDVLFDNSNSKVKRYAENNLNNQKIGAMLGNSDGHTSAVGFGITAYRHESILDAIKHRETLAMAAITDFKTDLIEAAKVFYAIARSHL